MKNKEVDEDADVYEEEGMEEAVEEDEISSVEEGFMRGYKEASKKKKKEEE